jgi:16S rRNA (cytosine1402-N4)-methyltransferase
MILEATSPDGLLLGLDRDLDALAEAGSRLACYGDRCRLFHTNFSHLGEILAREAVSSVDGILLDLGVSSYQLDTEGRGFSFLRDAPLDMRMDRSSGMTAEDLVNQFAERELERIIREYGEERWARRIASAIGKAREGSPITTTARLAEVVSGAIPRSKWEQRIHPATRTFQAIRICVNEELASLQEGIRTAITALKKGGRIVVISFHSLEDRIVKNTFADYARGCVCPRHAPLCVCGRTPEVRKLTTKPVVPGADEIAANPRSRSAKLRAAEKI